jgi:predicted NBD/HSP70 family sugar kinase
MEPLWGVDLGGTKIEGVVLIDGKEVPGSRLRVPTEQELGYEHILDQISLLVEQIQEATSLPAPQRIGIGTPGSLGADGRLKNSNTQCLNGQPVQKDLESRLRREVRCANDANCFALAEATIGSAAGIESVFGVIMGTGVGGGIVVNGRVLNGLQGIAGEWGHNVLEPEGEACYCGKRGCVETVLSGPALERHYERQTSVRLRLPDIARRAEEGEDAAVRTIQRLVEMFARGIAVVINILDPHAIVLGGGVGNVPALYERASAAMAPWVFNTRVETRLLRPTLGDSAGVFGAAMLCQS